MTKIAADREHWARVARDWTAWARKPGHDAFWAYRDALVAWLGAGTGEALDLGCGEGRVSHELKALGYRVTATDTVAELVAIAAEAESAHDYATADGGDLPFEDGRFDLVVAYNVLMDVEDVPGVLREVRRVLKPGGTLMVSLGHPFRDRGNFTGPEPEAPFVLEGSYYGRERFEGSEERDGLRMDFAGWSQPLENYAAALEAAGLAITAIREPQPDHPEGDDRLKQWARVPLFLWLKARPLG
jgi:SAM-dependent methyltransferase